MKLSSQAINSIELYRGSNPVQIKQLLEIQPSVKKELLEYIGCQNVDELALRLSSGVDIHQ